MKNRIDKIKAALPLAPFVAPYTGGLKPSGRGWYIGRCPFHQPPDDPPNKRRFWVNSESGLCGCFVPRCPAFCDRRIDPHSRPMDIINFYARLKNITTGQAVEELGRRIGKNLGKGDGLSL